MTENHIDNLAQSVTKRVWGDSRTSENFLEARQIVEELWDDDEIVMGIPGMNARAHQALVYDEAVRRLTPKENTVETERFDYAGLQKIPSFCYIDIHRNENFTVVVATEPDYDEEGAGTSVTNYAEHIATEVCKRYNIPQEKLVWVEHYDRTKFKYDDEHAETWDLVSFNRKRTPIRGYWDYPSGEMVFTSPKWQPLTVEQKDRLIEGDLTVFKELKPPVRDTFFEDAEDTRL